MDRTERERRRDTFLRGAVDYAAAREGYPEAALREALELARIPEGGDVLEVGCGTGQATRWLAEHGFRVLAIDRSEAMVEVASGELAAFSHVEVRAADFEKGEPLGVFDGVVAASSFHWLDPASRVERSVAHLRPGGALILLWNVHPLPFTGFFARVQSLYETWVPEWPPPRDADAAGKRFQPIAASLEASGRFEPLERWRHAWSRRLDAQAYTKLLGTHSDHRALPDERREGLFRAIRELIDREYGGEVERPYRTELIVARRRDGL